MEFNLSGILILIISSYLIGAIPTGVIVSKLFFGFDIREKGSGNMGSTNVFRVLGWKWGIFVQLFDILKGFFPVILVSYVFNFNSDIASLNNDNLIIAQIISGFSAILGHIFSIFVNFKGGKGVNTAAGMLFAIAPIDISIALVVFLLALSFTGFVSLGSILGSLTIPISIFIRQNFLNSNIEGYLILQYFTIIIALLIALAHTKNISRMIKGNENRFTKLKIFGKK